jgi:RNA polymerase sigma-70 factor (ECF subfamily)
MQPLSPKTIDELARGVPDAFRVAFEAYAGRIMRFAQRYIDDVPQCEEVVQEVFFKLWKKRHSIQNPETFESYLFTIAKNHIYNVLRRKVYQQAFQDYNMSHLLKETHNIELEQDFTELFILIKAITKTLPEQRRNVFILSRFEGCSNKEIAKKLGISVNTVETHMRLALKKFRAILKKHDYLLPLLLVGWYW